MLNMIGGVYPIDSGKIEIDSVNISREPGISAPATSAESSGSHGGNGGRHGVRGTWLAFRRGKTRGLGWGIKANEEGFLPRCLIEAGAGTPDPHDQQGRSVVRRSETGADASDGDASETEAASA